MLFRKEKKYHFDTETDADTIQDKLMEDGLIRYAVDEDGLKIELTEKGIHFFRKHVYTAGPKKDHHFWNWFAVFCFVLTMAFCIILKKG